ncbi:MAG TPA: hypothetical protein VKP30_11580 [Polyangiaceae bacterium]|nr:hypothetical protein [Polyangiaceae bacterium]
MVLLVVTLLTGIGLFAARVTGSVDAAAGFARQASQAKALALYAAQMSASVLANERDAIRREMSKAELATASPCVTNQYRAAPCALRRHQDLDRISAASLRQPGATVIVPQAEQAHGSLGPRTNLAAVAGLEGNLQVEYFERSAAAAMSGANQGGNAPGQSSAFEYSVTAFAQIRPVINGTSTDWCSPDNESSTANVQAVRMYIVVPEM